MLKSLSISNFKLIDFLEVEFEPQMTVITGETGAGKSIIISALTTLLGDKPTREMFVDPTKKISLSAAFCLADFPTLREDLAEHGFPLDDEELFLKRIISLKNDRLQNRAFINDQPATNNTLTTFGGKLVEIASQHQQQSLLHPQKHLDFLDLYGNLGTLRQHYEQAYAALVAARRQLLEWEQKEQEANREIDYLNHQLATLEQARLAVDEEDELMKLQQRHHQREKLLDLATRAEQIIYSGKQSIIDSCYQLTDLVKDLHRLDESFNVNGQQLIPAMEILQDLREIVSNYLAGIEIDPQTIEENNLRLAEIEQLKRKFRCSYADLFTLKDELQQQLANWENHERKQQELNELCIKKQEVMEGLAAKLSQARQKQAKKLEQAVMNHLNDLKLQHSCFQVNIEEQDYKARGKDKVTFLISTNPGETPAPLHQVISGGELSRFMLALKTAAASRDIIPTMIFDEADTGIGGAAAEAVGHKLASIARNHQVIAITHLPQVAAWCDHHLTIKKQLAGNHSIITVKQLDNEKTEARIDELARMGAGEIISEITREHARELVQQATKKKTQ
ncbi:MAG: DNA repair protein RecN [Xanthomonadaceae bacterium]|nr:DNA repair protein RecN [Xanthomonadaceae bacterium]